jgi:hypothetical protein
MELYHPPGRPEDLFRHIYGENAAGWLVAFSGKQARLKNPQAPANQLTSIYQAYYKYPEQSSQASADLLECSRQGRDAYVGVHLFQRAGSRLAANSVPTVTALWMDEDEGDFPKEGPEPTAIVHSSKTRRHLYWQLIHPVAVEWAVSMNRRIAHWADGDIGKAALASVLRVPGTLNFKRAPDNDLITMTLTGAGPWEPEVIDQAVPTMPEPETYGNPEEYDGPVLELSEFLEGVEVIGALADGHGTKFAIVCPWIREHSGGDKSGTFIGQRTGGGLWFHCNHAHCAGRGWRAFRNKVQPRRTFTVNIGPRGFIRKENNND